jgi:hypothetical protein
MHFLVPKYLVKLSIPEKLIIETSSGRSWLLCGVVFILYWSLPIFFWGGVLSLAVIIWSYKKEWEFDTVTMNVSRKLYLLFGLISMSQWNMYSITGMEITHTSSSEGDEYSLNILLKDDVAISLASRPTREAIYPVIRDIKKYLPSNVRYFFED